MQHSSKGNVLLMELIVVVLFFSLIAVTITQVFVGAYFKSHSNASKQRAWIVASDWAELLSGEETPAEFLEQSGFTRETDGAFAQLSPDGEFRVRIALAPEPSAVLGRLVEADVQVFAAIAAPAIDAEAPLVSLPVASYLAPQEVRP